MPDLLERLTAALAGRYAIEREVGRGGMAIVFLAEDLKHHRKVAIKVLHPELATAVGPDRFLREIDAVASLTHPHVLPLYDSGEANGLLFYIMPYVEGESLRQRLQRERQLSVEEAIRIAREVADALDHAHRNGLIHRDIKPANILLEEGHAVVADFGVARAVSHAAGEKMTATGLAVGTPAYMSPEQAAGDREIDARSDIYSLGCVLYEMLSGEAPYTGSTPQAVLAKKLVEPTPRLSEVRGLLPEGIEEALTRALAKAPADRFATAEQFARALSTPGRAGAVGMLGVRRFTRRFRQPRFVVPAVLASVAVAFFAVRFVQHRAEVRWAREEALPEIERLIGENDVWRNLVAPYRLAEQAEAVLGDDPRLAELFSQVSLDIDVLTDPPGARVHMKKYEDPDAEWTFLGVSPLEKVRVPIGIFRWKIEKEGYETVLAAASTWNVGAEAVLRPFDLVRTLDEQESLPPGMVRVEATETPVGALSDFFIGRYEVTNREYKAFVDAGGYRDRKYWKHPFVKDGRTLTWEEAARELLDRTGQPGPSTWVGGDYPRGQVDHPVSGVSWYEAAAYAEFAGMSLPTAGHWNVARGGFTPMIRVPQLGGFGVLAPFANFGSQGPVAVGSLPGITAYGAYDLPGNVREWCWNETSQGRVVRGGSWEDNTYAFGNVRQAPSMDRSPRNGFRMVSYPKPETVPEAAFGFLDLRRPIDLRSRPPVPDAVFRVYKEQFAYDRTELNAQVESREQSPGGWIHERISFDAAYGGERVPAHLFLPGNIPPPYQTVVYFPGSATRSTPSSENLESYYEFTMFLSFLVRSGRAVLFPVYQGTFERGSPELLPLLRRKNVGSHAYSEYFVQIVKDLRRSIDYLESRPDIDGERLAYYGMSWGANLGAIIPAVEERFRASVLVAGGLAGRGRPEVSDVTYVSRVRTPTLILNGRYDGIFPLETSSQPMLDLLGTPAEDKRLILYETDHIPPRTEYIREILAWLDKYLGPVGR